MFYHGTCTKGDDSYLESFISNGIQPDRALGFGQGSGFYVWLSSDGAKKHAKDIEMNDKGNPMIVKFRADLTPENFDMDYEIYPGYCGRVINTIWDEFKKVPDGTIQGTKQNYEHGDKGWKRVEHKFYVLPSKSTVEASTYGDDSNIVTIIYKNELGKEDEVRLWTKSKDQGNYMDAPVYAAVLNYFEANSSAVHEMENETFDKIYKSIQENGEMAYCMKYDGAPISINASANIEVELDGKWIDGQTYLNQREQQGTETEQVQQEPQIEQQDIAPEESQA